MGCAVDLTGTAALAIDAAGLGSLLSGPTVPILGPSS
jgi:hypothetical protein